MFAAVRVNGASASDKPSAFNVPNPAKARRAGVGKTVMSDRLGETFHALVATDIEGDNIRVVTMYLPDSEQWAQDGRFRRVSK